jgi:DNA-binding XRE family transcriptional regulator
MLTPLAKTSIFPKDKRYPTKLITLGDHIRKKRLDLQLKQKDVAKLMGVNSWAIRSWEKKYKGISIKHYPTITNFLGYCPYEYPKTW